MNMFWSIFVSVTAIVYVLGCVWLIVVLRKAGSKNVNNEVTGHTWDDDLQEYNNPLPSWWLNLFLITIAFALIYLVLYPGLGNFKGVLDWSSTGQYEEEVTAANKKFDPIFKKFAAVPIAELSKNSQAVEIGKRLFLNNCSTCHGSDARGSQGFPNLTDKDWLYGGTPEDIKTSILVGRRGAMPAWQGALGDQGVKEVVAYVQSLSTLSVDETMAQAGQARYGMCMGCHGVDGKGNQMLGAPDLTDKIWLYGGSEEAITKSIANGRTGVMPAHKDILGEDKGHLVATYVYSLSN